MGTLSLGGIVYLLTKLPETYAMEKRNMSEFWRVMLTWSVAVVPAVSYLLMDALQVGSAFIYYKYVQETAIAI